MKNKRPFVGAVVKHRSYTYTVTGVTESTFTALFGDGGLGEYSHYKFVIGTERLMNDPQSTVVKRFYGEE